MNYFEDVIIPESPRVLSKEQIMLYVPLAGTKTKGVASFYESHFSVIDGEVRINNNYLQSVLNNPLYQSTILSGLTLEVVKNTDHHIVMLKLADGNVLTSARLDPL